MKPVVKMIVGVVVAAAVAAVLFGGVGSKPAAPAVQYTSIKGEVTTQAALKGKVVLVNFWYPSCAGCVSEMPKLAETYRKYQPQGLAIVGVAMNIDPPNVVAAFVEKFQTPYFVAMDVDGSLAKRFGDVVLAPTSFLIDKQGRILQRYLGEPDFNQLHALIEEKLKES